MNLFSIFDPSTSIMSLSWLVLILSVLFIPITFWKMNQSTIKIKNKILLTLSKEISYSLNKKEKGEKTVMILLFITILIMNVLALYPQVFSPTSHFAITIPLSLMFGFSLVIYGWFKNTNRMLTHLVPLGSPLAIVMFMVTVELVSTIIRPMTLCVRLTANLIAGHLLLALLGNALTQLSVIPVFIFLPTSLMLVILESTVACIQAYVFMTLVTLFMTEVK
uniref:ATP synthase F0 subunit 6 n=1 Tax=Ceratozetella imperatoria TaxID=3127034 RepID=UPI00315E0137